MTILFSGGTGFIGSALCSYLANEHYIFVKTRGATSVNPKLQYVKDLSEIQPSQQFDVVINLAGEPIADKRWTASQKQELLQSRLMATEELISFFKQSKHKPSLFISGSAIGYYGIDATDEDITENDVGDDSFSSSLCRQWEQSALQAEAIGIRTCLLRTGIVLGRDGGALKKMIRPFKLGLGGKIGNGRQWMSWIHIDDMVGIVEHCISNPQIKGAINCTALTPVINADFTQTLGKVLNRPTFFNIPSIFIEILMGAMGKELLLAGKKVLPTIVQNTGYQFKYNDLETALTNVLK